MQKKAEEIKVYNELKIIKKNRRFLKQIIYGMFVAI